MHEWKYEGLERLRDALILDARIRRALSALGEDGRALVRDSLVAALQGECDEFCFQLFVNVGQISVDELE